MPGQYLMTSAALQTAKGFLVSSIGSVTWFWTVNGMVCSAMREPSVPSNRRITGWLFHKLLFTQRANFFHLSLQQVADMQRLQMSTSEFQSFLQPEAHLFCPLKCINSGIKSQPN